MQDSSGVKEKKKKRKKLADLQAKISIDCPLSLDTCIK